MVLPALFCALPYDIEAKDLLKLLFSIWTKMRIIILFANYIHNIKIN